MSSQRIPDCFRKPRAARNPFWQPRLRMRASLKPAASKALLLALAVVLALLLASLRRDSGHWALGASLTRPAAAVGNLPGDRQQQQQQEQQEQSRGRQQGGQGQQQRSKGTSETLSMALAEKRHARLPPLRFVCVSDTHGMHNRRLEMPPGDVLLFAGDAGLDGDVEIAQFEAWLESLPHQHKARMGRHTHGHARAWARTRVGTHGMGM
eukprot:365658-Chlamydomonas_euryale.AAC.15